MAVIRNLVVKIAADISSLSKGLDNAQKKIQKVSASLTKAGTTLSATVTAPLVALGTKSVMVSQQFEQSMANAASVAGATSEELARMTSIAREMGAKTVFSASDAADALYYMASAGYKVDQMADSIEATLNLASATQSDLAFTTETVISTLNQFGLEANQAERVTNVFAAAIGDSMASMDKLANSMGYVGPVANSLGYSVEETVGALSVLYDAGYDGSTAGTALRQAFVSLMNPSTAALGIFEELGIAVEDVNPATNDFATILDRLRQAGLDTSQAMKIFGARGGPGMLALMSAGGDAVRDMTKAITGTNKATDMAATQLDTLQGQWKILKSELEEIAISFGDVLIPLIRQFITKYISPLTAKIMGLSMGTRKQIVVIALLAAAIGPLLVVIGKVVGSLGTVIKVVKALCTKAGLIGIAIAAVVAILVYLWKTNEDFRNAVIRIWEKVKSVVLSVANAIKAWWDENGERIKAAVVQALKTVWKCVKEVFSKVLAIAKKVWPLVKKIVVDTVNGIKTFWQKYGKQILKIIKDVFTRLWTIIKSALDVVSNAILKFLNYVEPLWEKIKALFASLWDTIVELYQLLKTNGVVKYQPLGTFYSDEWQINQDSQWVKCSAVDRLMRLQKKTYVGFPLTGNASLYDIAADILLKIGETADTIVISKDLQSVIVPMAFLPKGTAWDALQEIANAGLCKIYVDREDKINVRSEKETKTKTAIQIDKSNMFTYSSSVSLTEFANRISVEYCDVSLSDDMVEAVSVELNIEPNASLELTLDYNTEVAYPAIETDNLNVLLTDFQGGVNACSVVAKNTTAEKQKAVLTVTGKAIEITTKALTKQDDESVRNNGITEYSHPSSDLVQSHDQAEYIANFLLEKMHAGEGVVTTTWRGNPELNLGEKYVSVDRFGDSQDLVCEYNKFTFDGGLKQETRGRTI